MNADEIVAELEDCASEVEGIIDRLRDDDLSPESVDELSDVVDALTDVIAPGVRELG